MAEKEIKKEEVKKEEIDQDVDNLTPDMTSHFREELNKENKEKEVKWVFK